MDRIDRAGISRWAVVLLAGAAALLPWLVGRKTRSADEHLPPPELNRPRARLSAEAVPGANQPTLFEVQSPARPLRAATPSSREIRVVDFPATAGAEPLPESAGPSLVAPSLEPNIPGDSEAGGSGRSEILIRAAQPGEPPERPWPAPREVALPETSPLDVPPPAERSAAAPPPDAPQPIAPWTATPLAPQAPAERSEQLEQIARQADHLTRHGYELANLKAYFAARAEFLAALRLLAQGLDAECQTDIHSRALARALTALREADDFALEDHSAQDDLDVPTLAARHATPVLKAVEGRGLSRLAALRQYLTYAQEQLALAAGREVAGAMALHALGKLYAAMASEKYEEVKLAEAKAVAFHQAALLTFPNHAMAANDLGVLLARGGMVEQARPLLERSVLVAPTSTAWRNLAMVYQRVGRPDLAQAAARQADALRHAEAARGADVAAGGPSVRWVDAAWLARGGGDPTNIPAVRQPMAPPAAPVATPPPARTASVSGSSARGAWVSRSVAPASGPTFAGNPRRPDGTFAGRPTGGPAAVGAMLGATIRGGNVEVRSGLLPSQGQRGLLGAWWKPEFYTGGARRPAAGSAIVPAVETTSPQRAAGLLPTKRN